MRKWKPYSVYPAVALLLIFIVSSSVIAQTYLDLYKRGNIELVKDLEIGGDTDDENYLLVNPGDVAVDREGNIYISDSRESCIKKFDRNGVFIMTIGQTGQGPGDLSGPGKMELTSDQNLVISESYNLRFSIFDREGKFINSRRIRYWPKKFKSSENGALFVESNPINSNLESINLMFLNRFSEDFSDSTFVDSMTVHDDEWIKDETSAMNIPKPFHVGFYWDVAPDGNIVIAYSEDYSVKILSPELKLTKSFTHKAERIKVTEKDKKDHFANMMFFFDGKVAEKPPKIVYDRTEFPKYKAYFHNLKIDPDGNILILTYMKGKKEYLWDVFTPDGEFVTQIELPKEFQGGIFCRNLLYWIYNNLEDFPAVCRFRVQ